MKFWNKIRGAFPNHNDHETEVAVDRLEEQRRVSHQSVDDVFDRSIARVFEDPASDIWRSFVNQHVEEDDDSFTLQLEVPGFDPKDLEVSVGSDRAIIKGERSQSLGQPGSSGWSHRSGSLYLDVPLRCEVQRDGVTAGLKHGVLTVHIPKAEEAKARTRRIPIGS
jgi:HSP20 family protein